MTKGGGGEKQKHPYDENTKDDDDDGGGAEEEAGDSPPRSPPFSFIHYSLEWNPTRPIYIHIHTLMETCAAGHKQIVKF